jgi:P27 family predicted phage terminase small subunit
MTTPQGPRRLEPPAHYDQARRDTWTAAVNRLTDSGGVFRADPALLDAYTEAVAAHAQASRILTQTSVMITRGDRAVENPALGIQRRAADAMAKAARNLGLHRTPMQAALAESPMQGDGRRWCDDHQRDECKHQRKHGGDCHGHHLIPGTGSCRMHVGMSAAAAREKGKAALARIYSGAGMDIDPAGALLWELSHSAALVGELRGRVAELAVEPGPDGEPGSGLFFGVAVERDRGDGTVEVERRAGPHAILRALGDEREHLVRTAAAAHTAGAQAAQVDAARQIGAGLYRLIEVILAGLELTPRQRDELVPVIVPAAIRAWDPAASEGP